LRRSDCCDGREARDNPRMEAHEQLQGCGIREGPLAGDDGFHAGFEERLHQTRDADGVQGPADARIACGQDDEPRGGFSRRQRGSKDRLGWIAGQQDPRESRPDGVGDTVAGEVNDIVAAKRVQKRRPCHGRSGQQERCRVHPGELGGFRHDSRQQGQRGAVYIVGVRRGNQRRSQRRAWRLTSAKHLGHTGRRGHREVVNEQMAGPSRRKGREGQERQGTVFDEDECVDAVEVGRERGDQQVIELLPRGGDVGPGSDCDVVPEFGDQAVNRRGVCGQLERARAA
jgi:hypothetical protein